jgi:hypothetical protein
VNRHAETLFLLSGNLDSGRSSQFRSFAVSYFRSSDVMRRDRVEDSECQSNDEEAVFGVWDETGRGNRRALEARA